MGYRLYGVIGNGGVLDGLRHPTLHEMQPLERGFGLCHVRVQVAMDEPLAELPEPLPRLTGSVLGYLAAVSETTPVVYVAAEADVEHAAGWHAGTLELGPLRSGRVAPRRLLRRDLTAVDRALRWIDAPPAIALGLCARADWDPTT